jgi:hypothetical protein
MGGQRKFGQQFAKQNGVMCGKMCETYVETFTYDIDSTGKRSNTNVNIVLLSGQHSQYDTIPTCLGVPFARPHRDSEANANLRFHARLSADGRNAPVCLGLINFVLLSEQKHLKNTNGTRFQDVSCSAVVM